MGKRDLQRKWNLVKMYRYIPDLGKKKLILVHITNHQARVDVMIFLLLYVPHSLCLQLVKVLNPKGFKPMVLKDLSP